MSKETTRPHPLTAILKWWERLEEFPRAHIAADTCIRLTTHKEIMERCEMLFREFLTERLNAGQYLGRTIAIRAVIDFHFMQTDMDRSLRRHLENVEGRDKNLKRLSNAAIGHHMKVAPEWENACKGWFKLKKTVISDAALVAFERACMIQRT